MALHLESPYSLRRIGRSKLCAGIATGALVCSAAMAQAQDAYPSKPVRLIVPVAAAGPNDAMARLYAQKLSENWGGKPVVVENRAGATGTIGTDAVVKAAPDGYTLLFAVDLPIVSAPVLIKTPYDPRKDLVPIAALGETVSMLMAHPSTGIRTPAELVAAAKAKPGGLTYSSGGNGSTSHLCVEMIKSAAGIDLLHVPYKAASPAYTAVLAGEVSMFCGPIAQGLASMKAGKLYGLGTAGPKPSAHTPELLPLSRTWPEISFSSWYAVFAPPKTPAAIVTFLAAELQKVYNDASIQQRILAAGLDLFWAPSAEVTVMIDRDLTKWSRAVKDAGIKVE